MIMYETWMHQILYTMDSLWNTLCISGLHHIPYLVWIHDTHMHSIILMLHFFLQRNISLLHDKYVSSFCITMGRVIFRCTSWFEYVEYCEELGGIGIQLIDLSPIPWLVGILILFKIFLLHCYFFIFCDALCSTS